MHCRAVDPWKPLPWLSTRSPRNWPPTLPRADGYSICREVIVIKQNGQLHSRLLTVREAARLMGVPEAYKIPGSYNDGYKTMGDAVAVPVAAWLAKNLLLPLVKAAHGEP